MKNLIIVSLLATLLVSCNSKSNNEYPDTKYTIFVTDNIAGYYQCSKTADGGYHFILDYNDRGRGPHLEEIVHLNSNGFIDSMQINGHNYLKDTVNETFNIINKTAAWHNSAEYESKENATDAFYVGLNSSYGNTELLVNKMLASKDSSVALLPNGKVKITGIENIQVNDNLSLKLIEFNGFSFTPTYVWYDNSNHFFASTTSWMTCIKAGYENLKDSLLTIQTKKQNTYFTQLASQLTERPDGKIVIKNTNVLDVEKSTLMMHKNVVISGNTIESILSDGDKIPDAARIIDGTNKTLMPGLFNMHTHIERQQGILHLAAGATSVRDLGNTLDLSEVRDEFNEDKTIGPRILIMCGFIDQAGPYAAPSGIKIHNLDEGLKAIDYFKEHGYQQIKLYSSIDPKWVKPMAAKAHELNLRVSGHIPAFMIAEQAINDGYNEIQHVNMIALNFMSDTIDTRTPLRFIMVAEHAREIDVKGEKFKKFVQLMKYKDIVLDPTVSIFEGMLTNKPGEPDPMFEEILDRLPIQVARRYHSSGIPIPEGKEGQYIASYNKLLEIIHELYLSGVKLVPGTDEELGFGLHKELENYVKAGIPVAEVLRIATINSARLIGVNEKLGTVEAGKLADLILVDGNPLENISNIRRIELVIKNGNIYEPKKLYEAIGIKYFK